MINVNYLVTATSEIADLFVTSIEMPLCPRAVTEGFCTGNYRNLTGEVDLADPMERILDDIDLRGELCLIRKLLKIAPAANSEILARRLDPRRGRFDNLFYFSKSRPALHLRQPYRKPVAGSRQWDKNGQFLGKCKAKSAWNYLLDGHFKDVAGIVFSTQFIWWLSVRGRFI